MHFTCNNSVSEVEFREHSIYNLLDIEYIVCVSLKAEKNYLSHVKHQDASKLANLSSAVACWAAVNREVTS